MNDDTEYEFFFTDITILETDGDYSEVCEKMQDDSCNNEWVISTALTLQGKDSIANFNLDFYYNGKVVITDYIGSSGDYLYTFEVPCLSEWLQEKGWDRPQPLPDLVRASSLDFWKHFWETAIIVSDFMDEKYGEPE